MWRIIVVEDEKPILDLNGRLLEMSGLFKVVSSFQSPIEALEKIPSSDIDALLLDIEMPRMTGLELAKQLVDIGIDVPIIFSTAYSQYAVEAFRVQALDYVLKPMTPNIVTQIDERLQKYYGIHKRREETTAILRVQLFGNPVTYIGDNIVKWRTKVMEELFYYFILNMGEVCSKWRIIDDVWPNYAEKRALANLYNSIYLLRQLFLELEIPLVIERVNDGYIFYKNEMINVDYYDWKYQGQDLSKIKNGGLLETKGYLWAIPFQVEIERLLEEYGH